MLTHRGFSAWISVNNEMLSEYLVAVDSKANKVSCWIPSQTGKEFTVHWQDHGSKQDTCAFLTCDGFTSPGRFLFGDGVAWRQGVRTSASTERPFMFQEVQTDTDGSGVVNSKEVGMIIIRIKKVQRIISKPANSLQQLPTTVLGKRKAGDVCIGYGPERQTFQQYPCTWKLKGRDEDGRDLDKPTTFITFVFRYRTPEFLSSQGIMPEDDSVSAAPTPGRRIVSAPVESPVEPLFTSNLSMSLPFPDKSPKKPRIDDNQRRQPTSPFMRVGSTRLQRPSAELRRSINFKTVRPGPDSDEGFLGLDDLPITEQDECGADLFEGYSQ